MHIRYLTGQSRKIVRAAAVKLPIATVVLTMLLASLSRADSMETYLALGDSIAFGVTDVTPVSFGDQGYVRLYADFLAIQGGGLRPHVINLAIPGESSNSFFTAVSALPLPPHDLLASVNLNYHGDASLSQDALLLATLGAEGAAGRTITNVSFAIGANDLLVFEQLHPDFFLLPPVQQQQLISAFAADLTNNYITVLTQVRMALPDARLLLLNYYNPLASSAADDPFNIANTIFDQVQGGIIANLAAPFHASVVDINSPFRGRESELVVAGGSHPTDQGYAVIEKQMEAASVPEPSSVILLATGAGALTVLLKISGKRKS